MSIWKSSLMTLLVINWQKSIWKSTPLTRWVVNRQVNFKQEGNVLQNLRRQWFNWTVMNVFHVSNVIIIPVNSMCPGHKLFQNPNKNLPNPKIREIQKSIKSKNPSPKIPNPKIHEIQKSVKSKSPSNPKILVQKSTKSKNPWNPRTRGINVP